MCFTIFQNNLQMLETQTICQKHPAIILALYVCKYRFDIYQGLEYFCCCALECTLRLNLKGHSRLPLRIHTDLTRRVQGEAAVSKLQEQAKSPDFPWEYRLTLQEGFRERLLSASSESGHRAMMQPTRLYPCSRPATFDVRALHSSSAFILRCNYPNHHLFPYQQIKPFSIFTPPSSRPKKQSGPKKVQSS